MHIPQSSTEEVADCNEDKVLWQIQHQNDYESVKVRSKEVIHELKDSNILNEVRTALKENKELIQTEIDGYSVSLGIMENTLREARARQKALKKANEIEKRKITYTSRMVQNKIEEALKDIGVDRGAAHGGDLQGRGVQTCCSRPIISSDYVWKSIWRHIMILG